MNRPYSLLLIALLFLASCTHKDGELDSRQRLSVVLSATRAELDGEPYYELRQDECQQWHWDGNELYRIDYSESEATFSENFYYDSKGRIERTTVPAYGMSAHFTYDGRKLSRISILKDDLPYRTLTFTHASNAISSVRQQDEASGQVVEYQLQWADDNVASLTTLREGQTTTVAYTYDNQRNPYRDLYSLFFLQDDFNPIMLCRNNPLSANDHLYTYTYQGHYPSTSIHTYSRTVLNTTTFSDAFLSVIEERNYAYLK